MGAELIERKNFLAIRYDSKYDAMELARNLKPYCECNWEDSENCDDCYLYYYLYTGAEKEGEPYEDNLILTWKRGFGDQFIIRSYSYIDSEEFEEDMEIIEELELRKKEKEEVNPKIEILNKSLENIFRKEKK